MDMEELIYEITPSNPNVIANQLEDAYYIGDCQKVNELSISLSNLRMSLLIDVDAKSIYYGNAGIDLSLCGTNRNLAKKMLNAAISLSSKLQDQMVYRSYLEDL